MKNSLNLILGLLLNVHLYAQMPAWSEMNNSKIPLMPSWSSIQEYSEAHISLQEFRTFLNNNVPAENTLGHNLKIQLPWIDGSLKSYYIMESTVMESEIAAKYSDIKTYKGTDGYNYMRMIVTAGWMKAYILTDHGDVIIEPLSKKSSDDYGIYHSDAIKINDASLSKICGESGNQILRHELSSGVNHNRNLSASIMGGNPVSQITYRIAIACTGEFGEAQNLGGGSVATVIAKMTDALTYANAIYERDFSIHLNMVNTNERVVFLNPETDPYINTGSGGNLLGQNSFVVNSRITLAAYDVGHVFNNSCTDVGGIASLACVCSEGKASGVTCWYTTDIAYVAQRIFCHEMGHQFSASHTFSNCNGNESGTRYEPGSGNSIMSYNGLCGSLNVPTRSGDGAHPNFYHSCSLEQVYTFTRIAVTCGAKNDLRNNTPTATILTPKNLVLPILTPFELKGTGSDMEDTTLSYSWEQYDNGSYGDFIGDVRSDGPLFRALFPSKNPDRVLPWWPSILNPTGNQVNYNSAEVLPSVSRDINFRYIVRDNHPGSGAFDYKELKLKVTDQAGPFAVTYPNTTRDSLFKNACNKVTWSVANTFNLPVNCKKVNIYLFKANEFDKLILLKENTDNDGVEIVDIPDLGTNIRARIMVKAVDHIFFDISDRAGIIIDAKSVGVNMGVTPNVVNLCLPQIAEVKIKSCAFGGYKGELKLFVESGIPQGSTYRFEKSNITEADETKFILDINNITTKGTYDVIIGAVTAKGDTLYDKLVVNAIKNEFSDQALLSPLNGAKAVVETPVFRWKKSINSNVYNFEIATSPTFGNTVFYSQSNIVADSLLLPVLLKESRIYFWRVIPVNDCGSGHSTLIYALQTVNKTCVDQAYTGNPVGLFSNRTHTIKIPVSFDGTLSDLNFNNVEVDADAINATKLFIVSPSGTRVNLFNAHCGVLLDFRCSFDDEAPIPIKCPPINWVRMQPFEPLAKLKGESLKGDWLFEINTTNSFRDGSVRNFTLQYCAAKKVTNPFNSLNEPLRMNVAETKTISNTLLLSQDPDNSASDLVYTLVSSPSSGNLYLNGNILIVGSNFTQKDIDDSKISYQHTGNSSVIDGFYFIVNDGADGWYGVSLFNIFVGPVATKDLNQEHAFQIYPNPGTGLFQIVLNDLNLTDATLSVTELSGKSILQTKIKSLQENQLDLLNLSDGVYFVTLKNKNISITKKLILNRN